MATYKRKPSTAMIEKVSSLKYLVTSIKIYNHDVALLMYRDYTVHA